MLSAIAKLMAPATSSKSSSATTIAERRRLSTAEGLDRKAELPQKQALPDIVYPSPFVVRNTFIDTRSTLPASLEPFYEHRTTQSCPTSMVSADDEEGSVTPGGCSGKLVDSIDSSPSLSTIMGDDETSASSPVDCDSPFGATVSLPSSPIATPEADSLTPLPYIEYPLPTFLESALLQAWHAPATTEGWATFIPAPPMVPPVLEPLLHATEEVPPPLQMPVICAADGSEEGHGEPAPLASIGSAGHEAGTCKPCAHFHTRGCRNGAECSFCHLCGPGALKSRQRERRIAVLQKNGRRRKGPKNLENGQAEDTQQTAFGQSEESADESERAVLQQEGENTTKEDLVVG